MKFFIFALAIRLLFLLFLQVNEIQTIPTLAESEKLLQTKSPKLQLVDGSDFWHTSIDLKVPEYLGKYWGYSNWYERNPLLTLFLYLTHRSILVQILLSALTCLLLFKLNSVVGILWALYPQSIIYSCLFTKVTLMTFLMVLAVYLFRSKWYYIVLAFILIQVLTMSVFHLGVNSIGMNEEFSTGYWLKLFHLWQPTFNHSTAIFGNWIQYIQMPFYLIIMLLFLRTEFNYVWLIVFILSLGAMLMYGHGYMREFIMPLIMLNVFKEC